MDAARRPRADPSTLHVVFHPSAAVDLRKALAHSGRQDQVVAIFDDLGFGPINPPGARKRSAWVGRELGFSGWEEVVARTDTAVEASLSHQGRRVAYPSRRCARDYANFLEWLWRIGTMPCEIMDVTDVTVAGRGQQGQAATAELAVSFSRLLAREMIEYQLLDRAEPLTAEMRASYHEHWKQLRAENAPLRVIEEGRLVSAPITYLDETLLSCIGEEPRIAAAVAKEVLGLIFESDVRQADDIFLVGRLRTLAWTGVVERSGDMLDLRQCLVRKSRTKQ